MDASGEHSTTAAQSLARPVASPSRTWFVGGALLLATVVVGTATEPGIALGIGIVPQPSVAPFVGGGILGSLVFVAALLVFAFGLRGAGSVTARRPLGTAVLVVFAAWILVGLVLERVLFSGTSTDITPGMLLVFGYVDAFVRFVLAGVAVIQIARSGVVPAPWNRAPAWTLVAVSVPWLLEQLVVAAMQNASPVVVVIVTVDGLVRIGAPILLGVVAIVLADRARRSTGVHERAMMET